MKKIIKGKVYDTDTAKRVGGACGGDGFSSWSEDLYQKRTGEFFLFGEGGPATKYAEYIDGNNAWSNGSKIIPLNVDAAREWVEKHLDADDYEEIFGLPDEDAEPVTISAQLPADLVARARSKALAQGKSFTAIIEAALNRYI